MLSGVNVRTVNGHLKEFFADSALQEDSVIRKFRITAADGKNFDTLHCKLPAIIVVRYKVDAVCSLQFRKWRKANLRNTASPKTTCSRATVTGC